jgi:flagellar hook protein FlgE
MSFGTGLSGLNAASKNLDVIGHNIANGNTTGMKAGRAEFSEMYASALGAAGGSNGGIGVNVATVATQFTQGNLKVTGNNLDMAINGDGFYKVAMTDGSTAYTRNGEFKLDKNGYIITNAGARVQGYMPTTIGGPIPTGVTSDLKLPTAQGIAPKATVGATDADPAISITANLPSKATALTATEVTDLGTEIGGTTTLSDKFKKYGTSVNVYDQQGNAIPVQLSFNHTAAGTWKVVASVVNDVTGDWTHTDMGDVTFAADGTPDPATALAQLTVTAGATGTGIPSADLGPLAVGIGGATPGWTLTQYDASFVVRAVADGLRCR